jgi:hypothetical protein
VAAHDASALRTYAPGVEVSINSQSLVFSLDSCIGVLGFAGVMRSVERPEDGEGAKTGRYTVPLER